MLGPLESKVDGGAVAVIKSNFVSDGPASPDPLKDIMLTIDNDASTQDYMPIINVVKKPDMNSAPSSPTSQGSSKGLSKPERKASQRKKTPTKKAMRASKSARSTKSAKSTRGKQSKYVGISQYRMKKWEAHIWAKGGTYEGGANGKQLHLGYFNTAIEAACAYDRAALFLRGEHAAINMPLEEYAKDDVLKKLRKAPREEFLTRIRKLCGEVGHDEKGTVKALKKRERCTSSQSKRKAPASPKKPQKKRMNQSLNSVEQGMESKVVQGAKVDGMDNYVAFSKGQDVFQSTKVPPVLWERKASDVSSCDVHVPNFLYGSDANLCGPMKQNNDMFGSNILNISKHSLYPALGKVMEVPHEQSPLVSIFKPDNEINELETIIDSFDSSANTAFDQNQEELYSSGCAIHLSAPLLDGNQTFVYNSVPFL